MPIPDKAGYYWARIKPYEWFHLVVHLIGEPPFLRVVNAYNRVTLKLDQPNAGDIAEWGPRIPTPEELEGNEPAAV